MNLAGGIILDEQGRVLLMHRNTAKRVQWEIPGGKVEQGEEPAAAASREVKEELGVDVKIEKLLGEKDFAEDGFAMSYSWYLARLTEGEPTIKEPQTFDNLRYFSVVDMRKSYKELSPNTQNFFALYATGL